MSGQESFPVQRNTTNIDKQYQTGWWFFATPLKNMSSSIGMMTFPINGIYGKIKHGNQTTNQQKIEHKEWEPIRTESVHICSLPSKSYLC